MKVECCGRAPARTKRDRQRIVEERVYLQTFYVVESSPMGGSSSLYSVKNRVYLLTLYVVESLPMGRSSSIFISFLFIKFVIGNWDILGYGAGMTVLMVSKDSSWPHDTRMIVGGWHDPAHSRKGKWTGNGEAESLPMGRSSSLFRVKKRVYFFCSRFS